MNFDKTKAMRNAERYVAQGKIRAAIGEYRAVVDADPRDIGTLNMLGDLHSKNADKREAVDCYMRVAEHYSTQGFAQKAIAIYNKISRLQPESIEVSTKLAELYTVKGSLNEARSHYTTLAEHYEKNGRRLEALSMWKQIALLDPNNTEVCLTLADSYVREGQRDEAAEAYAESGLRFARKGKHEEAIRSFTKGLEIRTNDLRLLTGLVNAHSAIGRAGKAVGLLDEIIENEPYNRDVLYLLIDCHIEANNAEAAEKAVIKLVEIEPANYPKLLDLIRIYLNSNDLDSAARILSMSSEYLLAAGQSDECKRWIDEILERNAAHVAGLRLLVRLAAWLKDEETYRVSLERLANAAKMEDEVDDERFALAHLTALRPHETRFSDRLKEINDAHGFEEEIVDVELIKAQFIEDEVEVESPDEPSQNFDAMVNVTVDDGRAAESEVSTIESTNTEVSKDIIETSSVASEILPIIGKYEKEIESIQFYVDNDYRELAEKALNELSAEFGETDAISALRVKMNGSTAPHVDVEARSFGIDEIRSEFGLEEGEVNDDDFDTHYHTAVAYQEMGLYEQAISEFQDAINLVKIDDDTRRFFSCANLLGHCFMQNGHANSAAVWFQRALETPALNDHEKEGLWYELALAFEADGDVENAAKLFESIYAENVDFRDVGARVKNLLIAS